MDDLALFAPPTAILAMTISPAFARRHAARLICCRGRVSRPAGLAGLPSPVLFSKLALLAGLAWIAALAPLGAEARAAGYDCLTTPKGVPRKVIVKRPDTFAAEPTTGEKIPLKFFRKYFVFQESPRGYLVGESTAKISLLGWVRKEEVLPWNTEQAIFFVNKQAAGRQPVRIWQDRRDIGNSSKPCFEEALDAASTTEPFPILARDGDLIQVAFLWQAPSSLPALRQNFEGAEEAHLTRGSDVARGSKGKNLTLGKAKLEHVLQETRKMDIVLVMDVTGSMKKYMDQTRANLAQIIEGLRKLDLGGPAAQIRVGVVAFRDYEDQDTSFVTKTLDLTADIAEATRFIEQLKPGGGGYDNEAVCEALRDGVNSIRWGEHSFRVMCLVGDAAPHTPDDADTRELKQLGKYVESPFFGLPWEDNLAKVKSALADARVNLYALGVGENADMKRMFRQFVDRDDRFLNLGDETQFIRALANELKTSRETHNQALVRLEAVAKQDKPVSTLTPAEIESLRVLNVDPAALKEMSQELIQTGWFQPALGANSAVCVYMRRRDLEEWGLQLRTDLLAFREKQDNILQGIASKHLGEIKVNSVGEMMRLFETDVAYTPEILRLENLGVEDQLKVKKLRAKLNNIELLLLMEKLFSQHEEGWVPMEYLPGALTELRGKR